MKETLRRQIEQAMAEERARGVPTHPAGDGQTVPDGGDGQTPASLNGELAPSEMYEPGPEIACGGMGAILRARDLNLRRTVAMKVILAGHQASRQHHRRFLQEARLTGLLEHPGIVPVYELGTDNQGQPFYTMKFVQGTTLQQVLEQIETGHAETIAHYSLAHLLTVFQKVCDAVAFAHSKGVIHRDLKPANIMLGDYGEVLVMDWGLAKVVAADGWKDGTVDECAQPSSDPTIPPSALTLAGQVMGSPSFMAPEQADGKGHEIDGRTDIFALGGILYNILTLCPPVRGDTVTEIFENVRAGRIEHPTTFNQARRQRRRHGTADGAPVMVLNHYSRREIPESLAAVAMKALAVRQEDRYQTVPGLQQDLEAYQNGFATGAEGAGLFKQLWLLVKRHKAVFLVSHTALLTIVILASGFVWKVTTTLRELRRTAPTFAVQAERLIRELQYAEALEKISYAITLRPDHADYHYLKGNIEESLLRIPQAREAYGQALRHDAGHARARANFELCGKLLADNPGRTDLPPASLAELQAAMLQQGRLDEAIALLQQLGNDKDKRLQTWREVLSRAGFGDGLDSRLSLDENGLFHLNLDSAENLSALKGMPLVSLSAIGSKLRDLRPLQGMPLTFLQLNGQPIGDLSPLTGMPLTSLSLAGCSQVRDLGPLTGMPLRELFLGGGSSVADTRPLKGMPLTLLDLSSSRVADLSPIRGMRLKRLYLAHTPVADLAPLTGMPLESLDLTAAPATNLAPLRGMPLTLLGLQGTKVSDLTPLQGMPLQTLYLGNTPITDVQPLQDMPLRDLDLGSCTQLHDLRPLASCPQLEHLVIPSQCQDIEFLRQRPNLKRIGYTFPGGWEDVRTTAEFWKEYDAKKKQP